MAITILAAANICTVLALLILNKRLNNFQEYCEHTFNQKQADKKDNWRFD